MFDIFLLLVPLLILPIVLLFVFVGCTFTPPTIIPTLSIKVKFRPARDNMDSFRPLVDIHQNQVTFPTGSDGPILLPDGDSQFVFSNSDFRVDTHSGSCKIICSIYLKDMPGPPIFGPLECDFEFTSVNTTTIFIVFASNDFKGCLPDL